MSKLDKQLALVRAEMQVPWTTERARRVEQSFVHRRRRRTVLRAVAGVAAALALLYAAREGLRPVQQQKDMATAERAAGPPLPPQPEPGDLELLHFSDGSRARLLDAASRVRELPAAASPAAGERTVVEVASGGARFEVVRDPTRVFRVQAGSVVTEVLGTVFTVERLAEGARVAVTYGRVRVHWPTGRTELGTGQSGTFPPAPGSAGAGLLPRGTAAKAGGRTSLHAESARRATSGEPAATPAATLSSGDAAWVTLAQQGRFDSAYEALMQVGLDSARGPADLLLAADVARLSHHPAEAVAPLRQVLRLYSKDPRAPLAAFTLGRGLLDELGRPREAAEAFRAAYELEPEGQLSADALAREVEAWSRADEPARAQERALLYLTRHPDGDRWRSVRRYGGLD